MRTTHVQVDGKIQFNRTQEQFTSDEKTNTSLQSNTRTSHVRRDDKYSLQSNVRASNVRREDKYFTTIKRKSISRATR